MYKFIKTRDSSNEFDISEVEYSVVSGVSLSDLCEEFSYFLRAAGYHFKGEVCIYDESEE